MAAALPRFCLEPLTLAGLPALEMVRVAAANGYDFISLTLNSPFPGVQPDAIVTDSAARAEVIAAMRAANIGLLDIECFNLTGEADVESFRPALECGHALGARSGLAILWDNPDRADALNKYRALCDMAAEYAMRINVEFLQPCRDMGSLETAIAFVRDAGRANGGVVIDLLHLIRTGSSVAAFQAMDRDLIGLVQLCDGPATIPPERIMEECAAERLYPGEGALPVREFIAAIPADMVVALEVPKQAMRDRVTPHDHAAALIDAARSAYRG